MTDRAEPLRIGKQTVFFGSSEDMAEVPSGTVSLVMTSPPYWDLKKYGNHGDEIGRSSYEEYLERLDRVWSECARVAADNAIMVVNVNSRRVRGRFYPIAMDIARTISDWDLMQHAIWYIPNALPQPSRYINCLFDHKFEDLLIFSKSDAYEHTFNKARVPQKYRDKDPRSGKRHPDGRCIGDVIRIPAYRPPTVKAMNYHVAAFPDELAYLMTSVFTDPGDTVLDPFVGSGTLLKVAANTEREGVGYEVHDEFRDLIAARIGEPWREPAFAEMDIISSASPTPGMLNGRRRPKLNGAAATPDAQLGLETH